MATRTAAPGDGNSRLIPVVILNWNGEDDTLECLRSIRQSDRCGFLPVVVDNGSAPAAVERLRKECRQLFGEVLELAAGQLTSPAPRPELRASLHDGALVFIQSEENLGFAKGSNLGVRLAQLLGADWVLLLNNDTVVAPDAFRELRAFLESHPSFAAMTPVIRHYQPRDRIQNCGGRLTFLGSRRYLYANREAAALPPTPFSVVTFVTGCALLFRHQVTGPLTEDFFFGEEDYEFSLRLKKRGLPIACVHPAVIFHKGGASIGRGSRPVGAILVHYVNRLVNTRNYYPAARWQATRLAAYAYLPLLLLRSGMDPRRAVGMIRTMESHLRRHRGVDRAAFQAMIMTS